MPCLPKLAAYAAQVPRAIGIAALLVALAPAAGRALAPADQPSERDIKGSMLHNLVRYVEWPAGAAPVAPRLCVFGSAPFAWAATRGGAAPLVVERPVEAFAAECQVAVVGGDLGGEVEEVARQLAAAGVLTVSDSEGFAARGVLVNFYVDRERVRFEVNLEALRRAGFRMSSKFLRLARLVGSSP